MTSSFIYRTLSSLRVLLALCCLVPASNLHAQREVPLAEMALPEIVYTPISLNSVANRSLTDDTEADGKGGWTDQGKNDLRTLPTGRQTFLGVPFDILPPAASQALILRGQKNEAFPSSATIPVGKKAAGLYFLHTAAFGSGTVSSYGSSA